MNTVGTTFINGKNPWTGAKTHRDVGKVKTTEIEICNDPLPGRRLIVSKYDPLFKKLKPGQCLKALPKDVQTVANGLRKHLKNKGKKNKVKSVTDYGDGMGRVWLMEV